MFFRRVMIVLATLFVAACSQNEPAADANLPVRYITLDLTDIATADALTARCTEEEVKFREHFAALEAYDGPTTVDGFYRS